jgi:predicted phosphodiesterase
MMTELKQKIKHLATATKMDNAWIADQLGCSQRSVRRHAGEWKSRVLPKYNQAVTEQDIKAIFLFDAHIPYQDSKAYDIALSYAKEWQPDEIYLAGDYMDFKDVSYWKNDPRRMPFVEEVNIGKAFLKDVRSNFPTQKIVYLEGNHEDRLARYMWTKAPELCGIPELSIPTLLQLDKLGIEYVSNVQRMNMGLSPLKLGKLYVIHGHEVNCSTAVVNLARTMYLKTHVNTLFGHHHQSQQFIVKKLDNSHEGSWMVGGLCKLSENYMPSNNWVHGFCTVRYNPASGYFKVRNKMIIDNQVL